MGTGKANSANNRQALLAEMLGMMAHLGNNFEQSPSGVESHRSAEAGDGSDEIWLSVQAACDYVHVSRTTMYRLVREGKLPSHRIRGRILINRETLDRCIKDGLLA